MVSLLNLLRCNVILINRTSDGWRSVNKNSLTFLNVKTQSFDITKRLLIHYEP